MIETKAMAYVNMYGVLGTLENLCQLDDKAKAILAQMKKPVSLCFSVKEGPCCTFHFTREGCPPPGAGSDYLNRKKLPDFYQVAFYFPVGFTFSSGVITFSILPCSFSNAWIFSRINTRTWLLMLRPSYSATWVSFFNISSSILIETLLIAIKSLQNKYTVYLF